MVYGKWTTQEILGALTSLDEAALPNDFIDVRKGDYRLLRYPERFLSPTLPAAQVVWSNTLRSLDTVFGEVASEVEGWGLDAIHWWVSSATRPLDTEAYLRARGGVLSDSYQILARELGDDAVESSSSTEIRVELVRDERSLRDAIAVETEGWGRSLPDEQAIGVRLSEALRNLETSTEFQFVAYLGGQPASTGWCTLDGEMGRLYGAVTLPEFRSRGCYRAVLSSRLRQARDFGATIAVTRGRPLTSGRILMKAGFTVHNLENCYRLSIS
jgi:GNAT superfamily N-acetyltransferase